MRAFALTTTIAKTVDGYCCHLRLGRDGTRGEIIESRGPFTDETAAMAEAQALAAIGSEALRRVLSKDGIYQRTA